MFYITKLKVGQQCVGRKVLKDEEYRFVDTEGNCNGWLFGRNIMLSAIVGKNGSGKSTITEITFRILNNFCAILCESRIIEENPFWYIIRLDAAIEFVYDGNQGRICCKDKLLLIEYNGQRVAFGNGNIPDGYQHCTEMTDERVKQLVESLFYCIAVNYAPFAYNSMDFNGETCVIIENGLIPGRLDLNHHNWLNAAFHKNDGYFSNITIVPFRNDGTFDGNKELKLARNRILQLLLIYPDYIEGYKYEETILFKNDDPFKGKFSFTIPSAQNNYQPQYDTADILQRFENILFEYHNGAYYPNRKPSIALHILGIWSAIPDRFTEMSSRRLTTLLYIVYKVLSCAKYPSLSDFKELSNTDLAFEYGTDEQRTLAIRLAQTINTEHSHITFKIEQALDFLKICDNEIFDSMTCSEGVVLSRYWELLGFDHRDKDIMAIARHLPPPFIVPKIQLLREKDNATVDISDLSAGERQFYNITSAVTYHLINLQSVNGAHDRVVYKNALVVLDEVELCFHLEYQRTFVHSLIKMIKRLRINEYMNIHFILSTHSPFILSDIPKENILYLEDGANVSNDDFINPFAANINDILSQSFFLKDNGFMGEYVKQVVLSAIDFLSNDNNCRPAEDNCCNIEWNREKIQELIKLIGEPLIKRELTVLYAKRFSDIEYLRTEVERLNRAIEALEN